MKIDEWKDASPVPTESREQQTLFQWAEMMSGAHPELRWMYHIPNEGKRSRVNGARLKAEGMKPGVPDICLPAARGGYHGLYIELKRRKGARVTDEQVCYGCDEAISVIEKYLKTR